MKLPTDPKMRMQLLILAGVVAVVALGLIYVGLSSLLATRAKTRLKLDTALSQLNIINLELRELPRLRQSRDDLFWTIQYAATNYVLFHEYRNYHLTARETLIPLAAEMGITIDIPKEGAVVDLPIPEPKTTNKTVRAAASRTDRDYPGPISPVFALYPVSLSGRAGYERLMAFIRRVESQNPYLTVADLTIADDPKAPEEHEFSMTLLWPIWKNLEQKPKVEDLILPMQAYGETP